MEIRPILSALMRNKTGPLLVAIQVALSMAILANALHVVNLRQQSAARPSGIAQEQAVFHMRVRTLADAGFEDLVATRERQLAVLRGVPGVVAVAEVNQTPLSRSGNSSSIFTDPAQLEQVANASAYDSPEGLVKAWGLKLVEGRDFTRAELSNVNPKVDENNPSEVVIITQALAAKLFPGQPAVGKAIYSGNGAGARPLRVVGVVERLQSPFAETSERAEFSFVRPYRYAGSNRATYTVRVEPGQLERVMRDAEQALRQSSPEAKIIDSISMERQRKNCYRGDAALSWMLIIVSCLLLLVTASGIVGMASLWVTQRRKQIGVRRALGARRIDILRYFITENVMITTTGIVGGVLLALALNHLMVTRLEMARLPIAYLLAGAGVFWALGIGAAYGPAWRAASISPATATRTA